MILLQVPQNLQNLQACHPLTSDRQATPPRKQQQMQMASTPRPTCPAPQIGHRPPWAGNSSLAWPDGAMVQHAETVDKH
jgi:hypothetical protein